MKRRYTWLGSVLIAVVAGLTFSAAPAQAETPNTAACKRLDNLALHVVGGRHVPDAVLSIAKRNCTNGNSAAEKIEYSKYSPPALSTQHPCKVLKQSPRAQHQAECVAAWQGFWDKVVSDDPECQGLSNARIDRDGLRTDLVALSQQCVPDTATGIPGVVLVIGGVILIIAVVIGAGLISGGSSPPGGGGPVRFEHPGQWRADRMREMSDYLRRF